MVTRSAAKSKASADKKIVLHCAKINKTKTFVQPRARTKILTASLKHFKLLKLKISMDIEV
jgi:hypothetical protein